MEVPGSLSDAATWARSRVSPLSMFDCDDASDAFRSAAVRRDISGLLFSGDARFGAENGAPTDEVRTLVVGFGGGDFVRNVNEALRARPELLLGAEFVGVEDVDDWEALFVLREPLLVLGRLEVVVLIPPPKMGPLLEKKPPLLGLLSLGGLSILVCPCLRVGGWPCVSNHRQLDVDRVWIGFWIGCIPRQISKSRGYSSMMLMKFMMFVRFVMFMMSTMWETVSYKCTE